MLRIAVLLCVICLALSGPPVTKNRNLINRFRDALERSRIDDGVLLDSRILANPKANVWENSGKFQGDIVLDDEQIELLVEDFAGLSGNRAAFAWPNTRWPGNVVLYEFARHEFRPKSSILMLYGFCHLNCTTRTKSRASASSFIYFNRSPAHNARVFPTCNLKVLCTHIEEEGLILRAMGWVEHFSCVRFRRRAPHETNYVLITSKPTGCYASVGFSRYRGIHTLNLTRRGCMHNILIIHELLHILGFYHMHAAYERYNYIRINWENIVPGMEHNFYRMDRDQVDLLGLPYEYQSSMHYSPYAYSFNRLPTIVATKPFPGEMGHMVYVTHLDWVRLRRHYRCPGAWDEWQIQQLKEEVNRTLPLMMDEPKLIDDIVRSDSPSYEENIDNENK